jgi:formylglycine-generating enzyme required for sulfatase activity
MHGAHLNGAGSRMNQQVRIIEPLGERAATLPLDLGGEGASLVLPGVEGVVLALVASGRQWTAQPVDGGQATLNGVALRTAQPLADGDVLTVGDAQLTLHPAAARIEVAHLAGNVTVAPLRQEVLPGDEVVAGVREIFAARQPAATVPAAVVRSNRWRWTGVAAAAVVVLALAGVLLSLVPVPLQLQPAGARVQSPALIDWHSGDRVFLLPGRRVLEVSHPGYQSRTLTLDVTRSLAGATPLAVELSYLPGIVQFDTGDVEAEVLVDGRPTGKAPGEISIEAGAHDVILRAPRHVDHVASLQVAGGGERQQFKVQLQSSMGQLALDTDPAGAAVRIDGQEQGNAPQRLELEAGLHQLVLSAPGRRNWTGEVAIIAGQTLNLGRIDLAQPAAATLRAAAERQSSESAQPEAAAAQPAPAAVARPAPAARIDSPLLGTLVLLPAGEYTQGSGRREQGRRSNEVQRQVTLTRPFYLAATEVSNAQFRAFRASHASGIAMEKSIDLDPHAVSMVTWNDAVEFCNWLSLREGLPVAYERRDGRWQLVKPFNRGYRLPTEAEWEYAARYVDGQRWQSYAWGEVLPPPQGSANLAGEEVRPAKGDAVALSAGAVPQYRDEHVVVAPVDAYARSPMGLLGLGGNVSEWVHDVYESLPQAIAVTDPMGPDSEGPHAIRGPNWRSTVTAELRLAWRERGVTPSQTIGFRVARFAEDAS